MLPGSQTNHSLAWVGSRCLTSRDLRHSTTSGFLCFSGVLYAPPSCESDRVSLNFFFSSTATFDQFFNAPHQQKAAKLVESCPESCGALGDWLTPLGALFAAHWLFRVLAGAHSRWLHLIRPGMLSIWMSQGVSANDAIDMSDLPTSIEHLLVPGSRSADDGREGRSVWLSPEIASRKVYAFRRRCRRRLSLR